MKTATKTAAKTITYEEFLKFEPCYLNDPEKKALMDSIAARREHWSALDILALDEIPARDRMWAALREELIAAPILHEFACRCAEHVLNEIKNPDRRSIKALEVKRAWLRGEATDEELEAARAAARDAAWGFPRNVVCDDAHAAAWGATTPFATIAARIAAWRSECSAAYTNEQHKELRWQIAELQQMLKEQED